MGKHFPGFSVSKIMLHQWEEPCITGNSGAGTLFFSGCNLGCVFCQNHEIAHENKGVEISPERLAEIFLELQEKGANNINLVTPSHYVLQIIEALKIAKKKSEDIKNKTEELVEYVVEKELQY